MLPMRTSLPVTKLRKIMHYHQLMLQYNLPIRRMQKIQLERKSVNKYILTQECSLKHHNCKLNE